MSKKQLYIHIGTHKTGTTAIQRFLIANSDELLKQKVLYPKFAREGCEQPHAHYHLIVHHSAELNEPILKEFSDKEITLLKQELDQEVEQAGAKKVILSCEDFSHPLNVQQWKLLRTLCEGYESFVIVYFRCQDEFLTSLYNQKAKHSSNIITPLANILEKPQNFVEQSLKALLDNYENLLSAWSDIVGDDHIIVTPYEGEVKNNVINHFLKSVGIDYCNEMTTLESYQNISISNTLIKLRRLVNNTSNKDARSNSGSNAINLIEFSNLLNALRTNEGRKMSNPSPLSPQKRREIIAQYAEMNRRIAQRYLGREKLFQAPLPNDDEPFDDATTLSREEWEDVLVIMFTDYMKSRHVLEEFQIKLRQELCAELYNALHGELHRELRQELYNELRSELRCGLSEELHHELYAALHGDLNRELRQELYNNLHDELHGELNQELYNKLHSEFEHKYQALAWLRIFNARIVLSFLKRKLLSAVSKLKKRSMSL